MLEKEYMILYSGKKAFIGIHTIYIFAKNLDEAKNKFYNLGYNGYKIDSIKRIDHKNINNSEKRILGKRNL